MSNTDYIQHLEYIARMVEQEPVTDEWIVEQTRIAVAKRDNHPVPSRIAQAQAQRLEALAEQKQAVKLVEDLIPDLQAASPEELLAAAAELRRPSVFEPVETTPIVDPVETPPEPKSLLDRLFGPLS